MSMTMATGVVLMLAAIRLAGWQWDRSFLDWAVTSLRCATARGAGAFTQPIASASPKPRRRR
jgi:hypothetical protein